MNRKKRKSTRLKGFDYANPGYYFLTVCTYQREHLFGRIEDGQMKLNGAGETVKHCWLDIPRHFPHAVLHEHVIMPNHIHGIIELVPINGNDGIPPVGVKNFSPLRAGSDPVPFASPTKTIGSIIRGFKIGVTKWFRTETDIYNPWQRNYHDRIIRDEGEYLRISNYIRNNPMNWEGDEFFGPKQNLDN
ncbi:transposase [Litoribacter populi]|uniref:transposase n=1 Tax=Litoribacter populi TaxID=2598460 RepID=UPI00117D02A5|nr:transposase [Litoribacter populi]